LVIESKLGYVRTPKDFY